MDDFNRNICTCAVETLLISTHINDNIILGWGEWGIWGTTKALLKASLLSPPLCKSPPPPLPALFLVEVLKYRQELLQNSRER